MLVLKQALRSGRAIQVAIGSAALTILALGGCVDVTRPTLERTQQAVTRTLPGPSDPQAKRPSRLAYTLDVSPNRWVPGTPIAVHMSVTNRGSEPVSIGYDCKVLFYEIRNERGEVVFSEISVVECGAGLHPPLVLAPGATYTEAGFSPPALPPGSYRFTVATSPPEVVKVPPPAFVSPR